METGLYLTIDTEMSPALHQQGWSAADNLASSIFGRCDSGVFGINHQMDVMEEADLIGIYFVDPMPALVYGREILPEIVAPIVERGHEVQLHIHTEWLEFADHNPVGGLTGHSIKDFPLNAQVELLGLARDLLCEAGAPEPNAFRAGNYGANDDTLKALHLLGIDYDTSFNPAYLGNGCDISLPADQINMIGKHGVEVLPVSAIQNTKNSLRHAQVCALSSWEMKAALEHAARTGQRHFNVVTHSFELLTRNRKRVNAAVKARFDALCRHAGEHPLIESHGFHDIPKHMMQSEAKDNAERLPPFLIRRLTRMGKQALYQLVLE